MKKITIEAEHKYEVVFDRATASTLSPVIEDASKIAIIAPADLQSRANELASTLQTISSLNEIIVIEVPEGESQKSTSTLEMCWQRLGEENFRRNDSIIGIGGGATTDLAGFVAATWLRGVRWAAIPTSLAGMVDAAVGGKTGINTQTGKNLVGSFYSPKVVIVDFEYLNTLPSDEVKAGMAEVIKCGFISDQRILEIIEQSEDFLDVKSETIRELIERAIAVKAKVVSEDLKESFTREILNYGHTLAHAIEKDQKYLWRHGDAVAVGLAYIANLSLETGKASEKLRDRHINILRKAGLPINYSREAWPNLLMNMQSDKKARSGGVRFVALTDTYDVIRLEGISNEVLEKAYERIAI